MPARVQKKRSTPAAAPRKNPSTPAAAPPPKPVGRPTKATASTLQLALRLYRLGHTDAEVAGVLEVAVSTLNSWKGSHPLFLEGLKAAKREFDGRVERKLAERAMGYSHEAVKVFCNKNGEITEARYIERYPPDTAAGIFWLCNRQPDRWKQKVMHSGDPENPVQVQSKETPEQRNALELLRKRLGDIERRPK